jgi:hypothetical protein
MPPKKESDGNGKVKAGVLEYKVQEIEKKIDGIIHNCTKHHDMNHESIKQLAVVEDRIKKVQDEIQVLFSKGRSRTQQIGVPAGVGGLAWVLLEAIKYLTSG